MAFDSCKISADFPEERNLVDRESRRSVTLTCEEKETLCQQSPERWGKPEGATDPKRSDSRRWNWLSEHAGMSSAL